MYLVGEPNDQNQTLFEVTLTSGKKKYDFNPSKTLRDKLGYTFKRSSDRSEIINLALEANDALKKLKNDQAVAIRNNNISFDDLVDAYKRSSKWRKLKSNSQRAYSSSIRAAKLELGDINVTNIKTADADALYAKITEASSLSNAYAIIQVLSNIWSNAQRLELLSKNPFEDVELTEPLLAQLNGLSSRYINLLRRLMLATNQISERWPYSLMSSANAQ